MPTEPVSAEAGAYDAAVETYSLEERVTAILEARGIDDDDGSIRAELFDALSAGGPRGPSDEDKAAMAQASAETRIAKAQTELADAEAHLAELEG